MHRCANATDFRLRSFFGGQLISTIGDTHEILARITEHRAGLAEAETALRQLDDIEGILTMWMGSEAHPMMFGPPALIQKLSRLSGAVNAADARPTASMYAVFADVSERFEIQSVRLKQVIDRELAPSRSGERAR